MWENESSLVRRRGDYYNIERAIPRVGNAMVYASRNPKGDKGDKGDKDDE